VLDLKRALTASEVEGIIPKEVDKIIQKLVEYNNPLRQNLPRKPGSGSAYYVNRRTASGTPAVFVNDTEEFTEATGTYTQVSFEYKTIGTQGKITRKARKIGANYVDLLAAEMEAKAEEVRDKEDWALLWGDKTADSKQFDGLYKLCDSSNIFGAGDSAAGGAITAELLDEAIDAVRGNPDMIICSKRTRRRINALLQQFQRFVNTVEVKGGFKLLSYNGIPIYISSNVPDTIQVNSDCTAITGLTGGTLSALFIVDTSKVFVAELTPLKVEPLAKSSSQFDAFDIYEDITLVATDAKAISCIIGIQ